MVATLSYDVVAIKALLAHGATVDAANDFRITPLMAASGMSGSSRTGGDAPRKDDVQAHALETIDLLLAAGADINARVTDSRTHTAKMTAYIQGRDHEGQTALFAAAESGWDQVTRHLVERGADPSFKDADGKLALDYARSPRPSGPGSQAAPAGPAAAQRAATVAYLETLSTRSAPVADAAVAK
jgi:ankyrin repeat protein